MNENELSKIIVDCCFKIHKNLGPGLFESVYEKALVYELKKKNLKTETQKELPVIYENEDLGCGFRLDILVENIVIIELKSLENILPVHKKQVLTYLKLSGIKLGFLINFNVGLIKDGITRLVNNL